MFDEAELRLMSREERGRLSRMLATIDGRQFPVLPLPDRKSWRRRRIAVALSVACCVVLAAWIGVLAVTLPAVYRAGGWRGAWIGFDLALLAAFASIAWTAWRGKQLLIVCLVVTATLLCCDAWFDLMLDWGTREFTVSVLLAVFAELPLAVLMVLGARRLLRLTIAVAMARQGNPGPVPPLWRVALFGESPDGAQALDPADGPESDVSYLPGREDRAAGEPAGLQDTA